MVLVLVLVLLTADMVAIRVLVRVLGLLECECGESDGQWDDLADVGNVPYLSVDYEAVRLS